MSTAESNTLRPLLVLVLLATVVLCQVDKNQENAPEQDDNKRVFFNWRILNKIHRERPGFFPMARPRTGRSSDVLQADDVNNLPLNLNSLLQPAVEVLPIFRATPDLFSNNIPIDSTKVKKNLGRWRNTNWIYSIRPDGPKFGYLFKSN